MKKMTKRMLIMIGAVLLLVALLGGLFFLHIQKLIASSPRPGPQTVTATKVEALEWQPQVGAVGTMVAVRGVDVTTEIAGLVRSIEFKSGQEAKVLEKWCCVQLNADPDIAQLACAAGRRRSVGHHAGARQGAAVGRGDRPGSGRCRRVRPQEPARPGRAAAGDDRQEDHRRAVQRAPGHHDGEPGAVSQSGRQDRHPADH